MKPPSGRTETIWAADEPIDLQPLQSDAKCDVCVIGAGIAGLSVAETLAREGRRVLVIDDGPIAGGETGRSSAHLSPPPEFGFHETEKIQGAERTRLVYETHQWAAQEVGRTASRLRADVRYRDCLYHLAPKDDSSREEVEQECEAARRCGAMAGMGEPPDGVTLPGPVMILKGVASFDPVRYCLALARSVRDSGSRLARAHAQHIDADGSVQISTTDGGTIRAAAVVVATNSPVVDRYAMHTKQIAYRTYVVAFDAEGSSFPRDAHLEDTEDPYHYVRHAFGDGGAEYILVGGEDHRTGVHDPSPEERLDRLEAWARRSLHLPGAVRHRWSGQVLESADGVGFVGADPTRGNPVYIVTGDCGQGTTLGVLAGRLIPDLMAGRDNPWAEVFSPSRKMTRAPLEWVKDNVETLAQYRDHLRIPRRDPETLAPGEAAVVRDGTGAVIACHRDAEGRLHRRSAICPHMKALVRWNPLEHTWDCPAHGSRFTCDGAHLNGPSIHGLRPA